MAGIEWRVGGHNGHSTVMLDNLKKYATELLFTTTLKLGKVVIKGMAFNEELEH